MEIYRHRNLRWSRPTELATIADPLQIAAFIRLATNGVDRGAQHAWEQLGHREREAVYQRAVAAELEAAGWIVELEAPVPVWYTTLQGTCLPSKTVLLSHDRADIVARRPGPHGLSLVVEVKRGGAVADVLDQATRYALKLGNAVKAVAAVQFFKTAHKAPTVTIASVNHR